MNYLARPFAFWVIMVFLSLSVVLLILGQTIAVFNYELAVNLGFQESSKLVSEFGVQINRGFGAGDTVIYIPLITLSIVGLFLKKKWSLITAASVMGISLYWAVTVVFMFFFLEGTPGYNFVPPFSYWFFIDFYIVFGFFGMLYLVFKGENLIR